MTNTGVIGTLPNFGKRAENVSGESFSLGVFSSPADNSGKAIVYTLQFAEISGGETAEEGVAVLQPTTNYGICSCQNRYCLIRLRSLIWMKHSQETF